jgi:site-specific recombinase XerD
MTSVVAATNLTDLVPIEPETSQPATNPAAVYLAGLALTGRRAMAGQLRWVAQIVGTNAVEEVPWQLLRHEHLVAIRTRAEEMGRSPATTNLMLAAVRGVCRAAWNMGLMSSDELARIEAVKNIKAVVEPTGRRITAGELAAIMAGIKTETPAGKRDATIIALAYCGGLRRREIAALCLEDVQAVGEAIEVVVRAGKGRKDRHLFIDNGGADALRSYLAARGDARGCFLFAGRKSGELLAGQGMTDQAVYARIKRCARLAGVKSLSPHDMRRTFVSDLLDAGADISIVARMAGHSSVITTARYDRRGDDAKRKAAKSLHLPYPSAV